MKLIFIVSLMVTIFSCGTSRNKIVSSPDYKDLRSLDSAAIFEIIKVDSLQNIYVILAKREDLVYKVVSFKDSSLCINKIKIGLHCHLTLKSVFPESYLQRGRVSFVRYGTVKVPLGGSEEIVWDLFSSKNLKGLCVN